ncbi:hypothetical protein R1sor_015354 [Riccia sorocarpa]|uniref:Uncharacterized protein n=1 Tax=Riccia sorocarpa TaxID=122646 RepID=A0ABD3HFX2_9MARC
MVDKLKSLSGESVEYHVELVNCKNTLNTLRKEHHGHGTRTRSCACLDVNCLPCRGGGSSETHGAQGVTKAAVEAEEMNCAASNILVQRLWDLVILFVFQAIHVVAEGSETEYWFKKACINLKCAQCGTRKFESALCGVYEVADPVNSDTIKWERYEYVGQGLKDEHGREKRRLELVFVETPVSEFIQFMKSKLAHFVKHDFTQKWQVKQYRQCIKTFPIGTVVSVIDYAENYTFLPRNEIQSEYWTSKQVTILVHIFYYHTQFSIADDRDVRNVVHFFISDDRKHDSFFVQHAFGLLHNWCKENAIVFEHHWVWSDGAPTQFKNSTNFFFVVREYLTTGSTDQIKCVFWEVKETDDQFEACELQEWVTEWDFWSLVLSPTGVQSVHDIMLADEFHAGTDHEVLSDTLVVGDVFAVKGSSDEEAQTEYWLLRCTGTKQKITEKEVSCPWNTEQVFTRDEMVVFGCYLEFQKKLKGPKFVYVEAKKKDPAVIYSHLVRAVKIPMTPMARSGKQKGTPRFCIDSETHEQILMAISEVEAPIFERL